MAPETIIERIQKLMQLEQGAREIGSLEEAANAAEKAQKLLLKYNLEMADITAHDPDKAQKMGMAMYKDVCAKKNEGQWIYRLYSVLAKHNFCDIVFTSFKDENGKKNKYVNLIGKKDNVEVVKFLAEQLEYRIRKLEPQAWNEGRIYGEKRGAFRRGYFIGACTGIDAQLRYAKAKAMEESEQVTTLVVANEAQLKEAVAHFFPYLRNGRRARSLSADIGSSLGYRDGKSMDIQNGVGGNSASGYLK